jgi:hypothetical protein
MCDTLLYPIPLERRFPTGMPRHTSVPQRGVRGAAKFQFTASFLIIYYIECHKLFFLTQLLGVPKIFFKGLKGCREPK